MLFPDWNSIINSWSFNGVGEYNFVLPKRGYLWIYNHAASYDNIVNNNGSSTTYINDSLIQSCTATTVDGDDICFLTPVNKGDKIRIVNTITNNSNTGVRCILYNIKR